jgi:CxxC motif-containing protein (DUF1111 family)
MIREITKYTVLLSTMLLVGCGGGSSSSSNSNSGSDSSSGSTSSTGVFIDDVVSGLKYINGSITGYTNEKGEFEYIVGTEVEFYLGGISLGKIKPNDNQVWIQDLVGVDRTDTDNAMVLEIARLLQSVDDDPITPEIEISRETFNKFENIKTELQTEILNNSNYLDSQSFTSIPDITFISKEIAKNHLERSLINHGIWSSPGGNATVDYNELEPFMRTINITDVNEIGSVSQGRELFVARWQMATGSISNLDGLGPLFNANACTACHVSDGRIAAYKDNGVVDDSFLFRLGNENGNVHPIYGGQLQTKSTIGNGEAIISWSKNEGSGKIEFNAISDESLNGFNLGPRIAPHLLGMGLLDLIPVDTILEYADPTDENNDGISGRAHWVTEEGESRLGRFGWKAINSSLRTQNAGALHQDMGLTTPVNMQENCTENQSICSEQLNGGTPEISEVSLQSIVNFMTALGVPERRIVSQESFNKGATLFNSTGCASCHRPTMTTGTSEKFKSLSNQKIYPYTDLLLHDMGDNLADGVKEKDAIGSEWRTPPLWGIGIVEQKEGARFLHDGRASTIEDAIKEHDGEALNSKNKFINLTLEDKEKLLTFLRGI